MADHRTRDRPKQEAERVEREGLKSFHSLGKVGREKQVSDNDGGKAKDRELGELENGSAARGEGKIASLFTAERRAGIWGRR
jgi:hypothetical protein